MRALVRDESGNAITVFAVTLPIFFLFLALALDIGNWYSHKRQLQNRADAAVLAAGVQYANDNNYDLRACKAGGAAASAAAADITNYAKGYAGFPNGVVPAQYNRGAPQGTLDVAVNSSTYGGADGSDGGDVCFKHPANASDFVSPEGGYWTDVKVRESNIPTFFGTFGINLPAITARARLDIRAAGSVNPNNPTLPFVGETGDFVPCVWAKFVDVNTGNLATLTGGQSNPLPLTQVGPVEDRTWEHDVNGIQTSANGNDIAVRILLGEPPAGGTCNSAPGPNSAELPEQPANFNTTDMVAGIDWIDVYKAHTKNITDGDIPAMNEAYTTAVGASSCGKVGYIYSDTACSITINASVDTNGDAGFQIYANDSNSDSKGLTSGSVALTNGGSSVHYNPWSGTLTLDPNNTISGSPNGQDYTDVGQHRFSFCWVKTSGPPLNNPPGGETCGGKSGQGQKIASGPNKGKYNCTVAKPCTGMVDVADGGNSSANPRIATYLFDNVYSSPLVTAELERQGAGDQPSINDYVLAGSTVPSFKVRVTELGLDSKHTIMIHDSVQGTGNRTGAANCGQGNGASGLKGAIEGGCPEKVQVNWRATGSGARSYSCASSDYLPAGTPLVSPHVYAADDVVAGVRDCLGDPTGNKTGPIRQGMNDIIDCTKDANHWDYANNKVEDGYTADNDPRIRFVYLTAYGALTGSGDFPVVGLVAFYITGWDGSPNACNGVNEKAPRDYTGKGTSIWGHYIYYSSLSGGINPSSDPCDLDQAVPLCVPTLVR